MEKTGSHIVHCLEMQSYFHMEFQIHSMTVILPGSNKCFDHSHCGRPKVKDFSASSGKRDEIEIEGWREGHRQRG